jgi:glycosyltransferase involved in cell wall biosynthesis
MFSALLYREAKALAKEGMSVDILCYRITREGKKFDIYEGINICTIQSRLSRESSIILYFLRLSKFFIKTFLFLSFAGVLKRYDVIHITTPPDFMVFAAIVPKLLGTKIIMDIHDIGPEFYMRSLDLSEDHQAVKIIKLIEKLSARFSDHVIAVTDIWRDKLIERSVSPSKCTTILNVPDDGLFQIPCQNESKPSNGFNLFYHGSLEELFGVDTLIDAMPAIAERIPNVQLHVYGGGRLLDQCRLAVEKYKIGEFVTFHKGVPFYELPMILAKADLGIVPTKGSVFSGDILAMKSLEYISLGIPIVVSKTKGHSYYYNPSMVKFFLPGNKNSLAEAVIDLYQDEVERKRLKIHSQHFIAKNGWKNSKIKYLQIVKNLI